MIKNIYFNLSIVIMLMLPSCTSIWGRSDLIHSSYSWTETPTPFLPDIVSTPQNLNSNPTSQVSGFEIPETSQNGPLLWVSQSVPQKLYAYLADIGFQITIDPQTVQNKFVENPSAGEVMTTWIYVLVAPFPSTIDDIGWDDFQKYWRTGNSSFLDEISIWMDNSTLESMTSIMGPPNEEIVHVDSSGNLIKAAWSDQPSLAIVPFEQLEPQWKVMKINEQSPVSNRFNMEAYPLKVEFGFENDRYPTDINLPSSNRDPNKLTVLAMTGVTALVRATAAKMENKGILYPGIFIRDWLLEADLTHISNEIPFSDECPNPNPFQESLVFCSDPKYITLLEDVGTDIVELTGNHLQDWGSNATLLTINMYKKRNWLYYGGGINISDAQMAKTISNNGNKLAFIGCNPAGPMVAWSTDNQPGAASCDYSWMRSEINRLSSEGYLPIVTIQFNESYTIYPLPEQVVIFQSFANSGAVIVSGSQAHLPQTMELINGSFIHYGLGNLFFDQMDYPVVGTRREFIDRHIFYDGKYISTELLTAILEDYSQPRPMAQEERLLFIKEIFLASGW